MVSCGSCAPRIRANVISTQWLNGRKDSNKYLGQTSGKNCLRSYFWILNRLFCYEQGAGKEIRMLGFLMEIHRKAWNFHGRKSELRVTRIVVIRSCLIMQWLVLLDYLKNLVSLSPSFLWENCRNPRKASSNSMIVTYVDRCLTIQRLVLSISFTNFVRLDFSSLREDRQSPRNLSINPRLVCIFVSFICTRKFAMIILLNLILNISSGRNIEFVKRVKLLLV